MPIASLALRRFLLACVFLATGAWILGCGGGGAGTVQPPPPVIAVVVAPQSGTVLLGGTVSFTATVANTSDTAVTWSLNHIPGGSAQAGAISADGVYTAHTDLPQGGTQPAGLGIIHLTLQAPSTAAPGARTLFIQNANLDRTTASGVLEFWSSGDSMKSGDRQ